MTKSLFYGKIKGRYNDDSKKLRIEPSSLETRISLTYCNHTLCSGNSFELDLGTYVGKRFMRSTYVDSRIHDKHGDVMPGMTGLRSSATV